MIKKLPYILIFFVVSLVLLNMAAFRIHEGRQAVITQFGKPIRTVTKAGLHWKLPFMQEVRKIDLRILNWDGYPNQIPTKDKKYIEVDTTGRWKISDPLKFIQTVQSESGARKRLDAIIDGATRDVISSNNLVETVRNSNSIFTRLKEKEDQLKKLKSEGAAFENEEFGGELAKIKIGREKLSQLIIERAHKELESLGINLIDVQLKRISYEKSVQKKVYTRMISERQRVAEKIRSYGKGEQAKIAGKTERDLKKIQSEAYRKVQKVKGEAEAQATAIYAKAFQRDPSFYKFIKTLEVYDEGLKKETKMLLTTDSKLWKILKGTK